MARTRHDIYDEVEHFIGQITDQQVTTWDELFEVAVQFCQKNYAYHVEVARRIGEKPGIVLLTAMLYVNHPLICSERGVMYSFMQCEAELIKAQLLETNLAVPVKQLSTVSIHSPKERN